MAKIIKGSDLMLFVKLDAKLEAIAYATSHTLTLEGDEQETSSKDSGLWKEKQVTKLGWSATSENMVGGVGADDAYTKLVELWMAREPIDVHLTLATEAGAADGAPAEGWTPDASKGLKGKALITGVSLNAPDAQNSTMTVSLSGTGKLSKGTEV